jgi:ATP/maltotriose-dependent transcriptional regulator MalT
MLAVAGIWRGELELLAGDVDAAERAFQASADFLGERRERSFYPTAAAGLARVLLLRRRPEEAWEALRAAESTTASDDMITVVWALGTRGRLLAMEGDLAGAREAAERAVALALETDDLSLQADSLVELAEIVQEPARASAALEEAVFVAERKGNVVVADQARRRLAELGGPAVH